MEISEQSYPVVDSSKFYSQSLHKWSSLSSLAGVTDKAFSRSEQAKLSDMYLQIISALFLL